MEWDEREAEWLLAEKYGGEKSDAFFADLEELKNGVPLAYLIGHTPFLGTTIYLDSKPLIPRTETEFWVEKAIAEIATHQNARVLDLCAGSGCIGVAVLAHIEDARVDFAEIDPKHHATIQKNITENGIDRARTNSFGGNLFTEINDTYDFILTNPPYIDPALDRTTLSVRAFEPHEALYGGKYGIELITLIIEQSPQHLTNTGVLFLEHEPEQVAHIAALCEQKQLAHTTFPDQYGVMRYTRITRSK